ncbi:MAG: DUF1465 family protein [Alphaproteobacteria bacterium]|nr:DUF1465 family protein [Alphaproteobacteria bacterium]
MAMAANSVFFKKTYDEAVELLVETRNYIAYMDPAAGDDIPAIERLQISAETMRVTARLAQVMAWMLAQKAAAAGEITPLEASGPAFSVPDDPTCLAETESGATELPARLVQLLSRSRRLYVRVRHLNALVSDAAAVSAAD